MHNWNLSIWIDEYKYAWVKLPPSLVKFNTNGSDLYNFRRIGASGIFKDSKGNLIYAFGTPLGEGSNNQAKIQAAIISITWCIQHR